MAFQPSAFRAYDCLSGFREKVAGVRDSGGEVGDSESVSSPYVGEFRAGDSGVLFDCLDEGFGLGLHGSELFIYISAHGTYASCNSFGIYVSAHGINTTLYISTMNVSAHSLNGSARSGYRYS